MLHGEVSRCRGAFTLQQNRRRTPGHATPPKGLRLDSVSRALRDAPSLPHTDACGFAHRDIAVLAPSAGPGVLG